MFHETFMRRKVQDVKNELQTHVLAEYYKRIRVVNNL